MHIADRGCSTVVEIVLVYRSRGDCSGRFVLFDDKLHCKKKKFPVAARNEREGT